MTEEELKNVRVKGRRPMIVQHDTGLTVSQGRHVTVHLIQDADDENYCLGVDGDWTTRPNMRDAYNPREAAEEQIQKYADEPGVKLPTCYGHWKRANGDWSILVGDLSHSNREAYAGWRVQEIITGLTSSLPHGGWVQQNVQRNCEPPASNLTKLYSHAAEQLGDLFCWCTENLKKFPPIEGDWIDEVKRRLKAVNEQTKDAVMVALLRGALLHKQQEAAKVLRDHAWLERFRKADSLNKFNELSPDACRDIAGYVDDFIKLVLTRWDSPSGSSVEKRESSANGGWLLTPSPLQCRIVSDETPKVRAVPVSQPSLEELVKDEWIRKAMDAWDARGVCGSVNFSSVQFVPWLCGLRQALAATIVDRDHWKANHDEMVARNQILRDRPDLTAEQVAERLKFPDQLETVKKELEVTRTKLKNLFDSCKQRLLSELKHNVEDRANLTASIDLLNREMMKEFGEQPLDGRQFGIDPPDSCQFGVDPSDATG